MLRQCHLKQCTLIMTPIMMYSYIPTTTPTHPHPHTHPSTHTHTHTQTPTAPPTHTHSRSTARKRKRKREFSLMFVDSSFFKKFLGSFSLSLGVNIHLHLFLIRAKIIRIFIRSGLISRTSFFESWRMQRA